PQAGQLVSAAPPAAVAGVACPQCGSPAEAGQEMCIVCGARIAPVTGGKPRGWLLPAVLAGLGVLLVGTAVAFGVVELTSEDDVKKGDVADLAGDPKPPPPATTTEPQPPASTTPTIPPASGGDTPPPKDQTQPADPPETTTPSEPSTGTPAEWPAGKTAYTVVLVSATSRNAADAKAEQAIKRGIEAGVLRSDDFSTLRPGYWVVFAGQFDTSEQATRAADRYASQGFGGGYPRQVKPK
nr:SPOR domain-containing protein [Actinomycetota bacterium]